MFLEFRNSNASTVVEFRFLTSGRLIIGPRNQEVWGTITEKRFLREAQTNFMVQKLRSFEESSVQEIGIIVR